jgi:hypothetical protein
MEHAECAALSRQITNMSTATTLPEPSNSPVSPMTASTLEGMDREKNKTTNQRTSLESKPSKMFSIYSNSWFQILLISAICFCCPGVRNPFYYQGLN